MHKNDDLPQVVVKGSIFSKIVGWFRRIIAKDNNIDETTIVTNKNDEKTFAESIKVEDKTELLNLQKQLKEDKIKNEELTDEQLAQMIELYKSQIEQKKMKLKQYRQIIKVSGAPE